MSVQGLMETSIDATSGNASVLEACDVMNRYNSGAVAVLDGGKLVGIFTYRDLIERVILKKRDPASTLLADVMTRDVHTLSVERSYGDALRLMVDKDYTYVPVVRGDGGYAGMLSLRSLLEHRIDHLAGELDTVSQYIAVDGPGGD